MHNAMEELSFSYVLCALSDDSTV